MARPAEGGYGYGVWVWGKGDGGLGRARASAAVSASMAAETAASYVRPTPRGYRLPWDKGGWRGRGKVIPGPFKNKSVERGGAPPLPPEAPPSHVLDPDYFLRSLTPTTRGNYGIDAQKPSVSLNVRKKKCTRRSAFPVLSPVRTK